MSEQNDDLRRDLERTRVEFDRRFADLIARLDERHVNTRETAELYARSNDDIHQQLLAQVDALRIQATTHITRNEYQAAHGSLADRLQAATNVVRENVREIELRVASRIESIEGQAIGLRRGWMVLIGAISAAAAVAAIVGAVLGR